MEHPEVTRSSNLQEATEDLMTDALGFAQIWVEAGLEIGRAALDAVSDGLRATGAILERTGAALDTGLDDGPETESADDSDRAAA